jgi:hypothetical protein
VRFQEILYYFQTHEFETLLWLSKNCEKHLKWKDGRNYRIYLTYFILGGVFIALVGIVAIPGAKKNLLLWFNLFFWFVST